jgi:hypothetical protein
MNKIDFIALINSMPNAKRIYRDSLAKFAIENDEAIEFLVDLTFENEKKTAIKSAWVLELVCLENIDLIAKYLVFFSENINKPSHESILRPLSKICFQITNAYYSKSDNKIKNIISDKIINNIIEANFDWLINNHNVANQVFAMDTLFLFGKEFHWIHDELKLVLEQNILEASSGYQVRAKRILKKLNI